MATARQVLDAFERGRDRAPLERALAVLDVLGPRDDGWAGQPLGVRDRALLELLDGSELDCVVRCPACDEQLEFTLPKAQLLELQPPAPVELELHGVTLRVRPATSEDVAVGVAEGIEALRRRCVSPTEPLRELTPEQLDQVDEALRQADPLADIVLSVRCMACDHPWQTTVDAGEHLWSQLQARAARLLDDVSALAAAYGWAEGEILAMSEVRRLAYLQRIAS